MRNLKKIFAVIMVVALMASMMVPALAAGTVNDEKAVKLNNIGLMSGMGLSDSSNRIQGLIFAIKAAGKQADVEALTDAEVAEILANVVDADEIPAWGVKYAAYAVKQGYTSGTDASIAPKVKFSALQPISATSFLTWLLRIGMGYSDVGTANAVSAAVEAKVLSLSDAITIGSKGELIRDDIAGILYGAAVNGVNKDGKTFIQSLIDAKFVSEAVAAENGFVTLAPVTLAVTNVTALNLKQIKIDFNMTVDKTEAGKIANYRAYNGGASSDLAAGGSVSVAEDLKSVVVTLGGSFNNGTTGKVEVKYFVTYSNDNVLAADTTIPTVVGISVTGPKSITVEYSEPITNIDNAEYTVDDGNYIVTNTTADGSNKVVVEVGVNLTAGEHKIKINGTNVTDYAGYKVIPVTKTFTFAADSTAPTVSIKEASPTKVVLAFSKPISNAKDANVLYRHTYNDSIYELAGTNANVTVNAAGTEVTIDWGTAGKIIPLGNTNFYLAYGSDSGTKIQDLWGNKVAATTLPLNITLDTTKPTVTAVEFVDAQTLKVKFSEEVDQTTAETKSNYTVKDSSGKAIAVSSATKGTGDDVSVVTLGFAANALGGGTYTVTVKGVKDTALVKNVMDEYTTTITTNDTVKPTVKDSTVSGIGSTEVKVYIPFSEQMAAGTLIKANFLKNVNGGGLVALGSDDSIAIAPDGKSVTITIKNGSTNITSLGMRIGAVTDLAGNSLLGIIADSTTGVPSANEFKLTADSVAVKSVEATAKNTLKVTFTGRLASVSAAGFELWDKDTEAKANVSLSVTSHTINDDNQSVVIITLGSDLSEAAELTAGKQVQLVVTSAATGTKSYLGTQVTAEAFASAATATRDVQDKIAPTVKSVKVDSATQITVTFNEKLEADTFAKTLNGFSVSGGDSKLTAVAINGSADSAEVILTGTDFVAGTTKVSYNDAAGLTDLIGNKVASFTDKSAD